MKELSDQDHILKKLEISEDNIPFDKWYRSLKDKKTRAVIAARLLRIQKGNLGDVKPIGGGVFEFRIHYGAGYRIYFGQANEVLVVLICGGDKSTQDKDIQEAIALWGRYKDEIERYSRDFGE